MKAEDTHEEKKGEIDLKNAVFASNPELYQEIWPFEQADPDREIEYLQPQTQEEVDDIMAAIRSAGVS